MKVTQTGNSQVASNEVASSRKAGVASRVRNTESTSNAEAASAIESGDVKTTISGRAKEMAHAKAVATGAPETREEKIAELKRRIAEGSYKVDSHKIADRMVDEHLKMPGA